MHKEGPATLYRIYVLSMQCCIGKLLYIDKGGRAADFTLMWVFSGTFVNVMFSQSPFLYFIMKGQLFNITPNNALFKDK